MKRDLSSYLKPLDFKHGCIDMNHGAGGRVGAQLVDELFVRAFDNPYLRQGNDGARLEVPQGQRLVMATDAHVISPLFFPGGDIGSLAVHGTVNDVAMLGAMPLYLSASFILEEGLPLAQLARIVESMATACARLRRARGHRRHQGGGAGQGRRRVHQHHRHRPDAACSATSAAPTRACRRRAAAVGQHRRAWRGGAVAARIAAVRHRHRVRQRPVARPGGRAAGGAARRRGARAARPHARRPGDHAERDRAASRASACCSTRRPFPCCRRWRPPASCWGWTRCTSPTKASWSRSSRPRWPTPRWPRCARIRWAARLRASARCTTTRSASCRCAPRIGGQRIVDWLSGEPLPRIC